MAETDTPGYRAYPESESQVIHSGRRGWVEAATSAENDDVTFVDHDRPQLILIVNGAVPLAVSQAASREQGKAYGPTPRLRTAGFQKMDCPMFGSGSRARDGVRASAWGRHKSVRVA